MDTCVIAVWLATNEKLLRINDVRTARLDCLVLLEDVVGKDRSWLLANPQHELSVEQFKKLNSLIMQRSQHIPLAYLRGKSEFYGREFTINEYVLEPRPESETIIELLNAHLIGPEALYSDLEIIDIGTGSGALAITAKLELPDAHVLGIDIDKKCLEVARQNAQALDANVTFLQGNILEPLFGRTNSLRKLLICNLPYVPNSYPINRAATFEPQLALFGGQDGLDLYRELFTQSLKLPHIPTYILAESLPEQHKNLAAIAKSAGYSLKITDDFVQLFTS